MVCLFPQGSWFTSSWFLVMSTASDLSPHLWSIPQIQSREQVSYPPHKHFFYVSLIHFEICLTTIAVKILIQLEEMPRAYEKRKFWGRCIFVLQSFKRPIWSSMLHLCAKELNTILIEWMECARNILKPIKGSINQSSNDYASIFVVITWDLIRVIRKLSEFSTWEQGTGWGF